jgi:hypothetical protein
MLRLGIFLPLPVHDAAYGGDSLVTYSAVTHRVDVSRNRRMIVLRSGSNPNQN